VDFDEIPITDSARRAVDSYIAYERQRIISNATAQARLREPDLREVTSSDVFAVIDQAGGVAANQQHDDDQTQLQRRVDRREPGRVLRLRQRRRVLAFGYVYGATFAIGGILATLYFQIRDSLTGTSAVSLSLVLAGFGISATTAAYSVFLRKRDDERALALASENSLGTDAATFLVYWAEVETAVRGLADGSETGKDASSLRAQMAALVHDGIVSGSEADLFFSALRIRNKLVHSGLTNEDDDKAMASAMLKPLVDLAAALRRRGGTNRQPKMGST
jgi:hypothetical protein